MNVTADELADAVLTASRALVGVAAKSLAAAPADVTLPQYRVLVVVATRGPQRPTDLAAELGVAASSITRLCDRLVRKKLVMQLRAANRREYEIQITDQGQAIVDAVMVSRRLEIRRLLGRIPPGRRQQLLVTLRELSLAAGEPESPASPLGWPV